MLTPFEIAVLRVNGQLDEAYAAVCQSLAANPDNIELRRLLGFIICDRMKLSATSSPALFIDQLRDFRRAAVPASETRLYDNLLWNIRAFVLDEHKSADQLPQYLTALFDVIRDMPIRRICAPFSLLVSAVLHRGSKWSRVGEFAYWCGFDCLRDEDFRPFLTKEGKHLMALAEQLDCKIAKMLLDTNDQQRIRTFIPQQETLCLQHPNYVYPPYYLAKMYLSLGNSDKALSLLLPFVRKKPNEFWVWELLAEAATDGEMQLAFFCKALLCKTREGMNVSLLQNAATCFANAGLYDAARYLIDQASRIRQNHHWALTQPLLSMMRQPWYAAAQSHINQRRVEQKAAEAETHIPHLKKKTATMPPVETMPFSGTLHLNAKGFGFVKDVYIPARLLARQRNGDTISGLAEKRFDKKKNQWGFAAVKINE